MTIDNIAGIGDPATAGADGIGETLYLQTAAELAAGITPTNYAYEELNVHRYGAIGDGVASDQAAFVAAVAVMATGQSTNGFITGKQLRYLVTGLTISGPCAFDFGNPIESYTAGTGAQIYSKTDAPIIQYTGSSVVGLRNVNIVGTVSGSTASQSGVELNATYPTQTRIRMENVGIFNCGQYGLYIGSSYVSTFQNLYVQGCASVGILDGPNSGANKFYNVTAESNGSAGIDVQSTNGSNEWFGVVSSSNAYGIIFESGAVGHIMYGVHTEHNTIISQVRIRPQSGGF